MSLREKISAAEGLLMNRLHTCRTDHNLMNSLYHILQQNGNVKISDLCSYTGVSKKTLERIFHENTGVSPKTMQSLIRYQLLWQDIYFHRRFNALDAVAKYGYFDQAHLLRDFKRRHTTTPAEALRFALENI